MYRPTNESHELENRIPCHAYDEDCHDPTDSGPSAEGDKGAISDDANVAKPEASSSRH